MAFYWNLKWLGAVFIIFSRGTAALDCINTTDYKGDYLLCVGRPGTAEVGQNVSFEIEVVTRIGGKPVEKDGVLVELNVTLVHHQLANISDHIIVLSPNWTLHLHSLEAGRSELLFECVNESNSTTCPFNENYTKLVRREVSFAHSLPLNVVIIVVGWIYFLAWSISFYPQIFLNFYRRSVIGLNFDFLALNITGFLAYTVFNIGLFWIHIIKEEYFVRHPSGVNPVLLNDVVFSIHAVIATAFTIFQCFIFKHGGQRISITAVILLVLLWLTLVISVFVAVGGKLHWLDFLYVASYVKLVITLLKYIPQAWLNFRRRSTSGWSIGNVLLDFTGGTFSILQMFLLSYNYDDWKSIFGDPTKFGLGLFSILFDLLFMFQHYVLFRNSPDPSEFNEGYNKIGSNSYNEEDEEDSLSKRKSKVNEDRSVSPSLSDEERPLLRSDPKNKGIFQKLLGAFRLKK